MVHEQGYAAGSVVVQAGDTDEKLFVIKRGEAAVHTDDLGGDDVATLTAGQYFGELALTGRKHKRSASITAKGPERLHLISLSISAVRTPRARE